MTGLRNVFLKTMHKSAHLHVFGVFLSPTTTTFHPGCFARVRTASVGDRIVVTTIHLSARRVGSWSARPNS